MKQREWCTGPRVVRARTMTMWRIVLGMVISFNWPIVGFTESQKVKLLLVESYHQEFLTAQYTHRGWVEGLLKFGYLDDQAQGEALLKDDMVESSKAIIKVLWMDTKRKSSKPEMQATAMQIVEQVRAFSPNLLFLAEDNAANYIGNQFLDTELPIVLWGINNTLVKYGLVDSAEHPGHNITGVVEPEHFAESLQLLKAIVPTAKTFGILADESDTGRANAKAVQFLEREGKLPLQLVETVSTNEFEMLKQKALELQGKVDAFLVIVTVSKDAQGNPVSDETVMRWYLQNIRKPDVGKNRRGVVLGLLCAAETSAYNQGFEGARIAYDILTQGTKPATYPAVTPKRGSLLVNRQRAKMLGITLTPEMGVEEIIEEAAALKEPAGKP